MGARFLLMVIFAAVLPAQPLTAPLSFVALSPCRLLDTRAEGGKTGVFGPPIAAAGATRTLPVLAAGCAIPADAQALSLNITVVPVGELPYVTVWPTGQPRPLASTLNSFRGKVVANAAVVALGSGGGIDLFVAGRTDVIMDINGYFTATATALPFYSIAPCRVMDTRAGEGKTGLFGPPVLAAGASRDVPVAQSSCGIPVTARAYLLNLTVVPKGPLSYVTVWPTGQSRPLVSTLNSYDGRVVANAALVPAGIAGAITLFATDAVDIILDINGYFAP